MKSAQATLEGERYVDGKSWGLLIHHTRSRGNMAGLIGLISCQHGPRRTRILCRERHGGNVFVSASTQFDQPGISHLGLEGCHADNRGHRESEGFVKPYRRAC